MFEVAIDVIWISRENDDIFIKSSNLFSSLSSDIAFVNNKIVIDRTKKNKEVANPRPLMGIE